MILEASGSGLNYVTEIQYQIIVNNVNHNIIDLRLHVSPSHYNF